MERKIRPLLSRPKPKRDESCKGYILRLTEANGYDTPYWIIHLISPVQKKYNWHGSDSFARGNPLDLPLLSELALITESDSSKKTYSLENSTGLSTKRCYFFDKTIPKYWVRSLRPKVCPECLLESNYCRKLWELSAVTACPIHSCLLIDECPGCKKRMTWTRNQVSVCPCGYDWRNADAQSVEDSQLAVSKQVHKLCGLTPAATTGDLSNNNLLFSLDLEFFLSALSFISGQYAGILDFVGKQFGRLGNNAEIHVAINRAFTVFENWPNNFHIFLNWRKEQENYSISHTGLCKDFGAFYFGLFQYLPSLQFNFIRKAFQDYVATNWEGGYAYAIKRQGGAGLGNLAYVSKKEAQKRLKKGASRIYKLIGSGVLKAKISTRGKTKIILMESASVEELKIKIEQLISMGTAANLLGLGSKGVRDLVRHQYLEPIRDPTVDGPCAWKFNQDAVLDIYHRVRDMIPKAQNSNSHNTIDFQHALMSLQQIGYTTGRAVQAILNGKVTPRGENGKRGLSGLLFDREEISCFVRQQAKSKVTEPQNAR